MLKLSFSKGMRSSYKIILRHWRNIIVLIKPDEVPITDEVLIRMNQLQLLIERIIHLMFQCLNQTILQSLQNTNAV